MKPTAIVLLTSFLVPAMAHADSRMSPMARGAVYDHYYETGGVSKPITVRATKTTPTGWDYKVTVGRSVKVGFVDKSGDVFPGKLQPRYKGVKLDGKRIGLPLKHKRP
jgi:hypothetical protein